MTMARKVDPARVGLRAAPPRVMRLNRRAIVVLCGGLVAAVLLATAWSLRSPQRPGRESNELFNVDRIARSEQLEKLPADYSQLPPALGEPLPGDLGAAMLKAGVPVSNDDAFADLVQSDAMNLDAGIEEAARSPLFFELGRTGSRPALPAMGEASSSVVASSGMPANAVGSLPVASPFDALTAAVGSLLPGDSTTDPGGQGRKTAFAAGTSNGTATVLTDAPSPYTVMAGTVIPAALVTGINSDLPGQVIASVTEDVRDTATGQFVLIPQGSRLLGRYDSQVAFGQRRVLLVWTRLILPDTASIELDRLPGVDAAGYAGLEDGIDRHWGRLLGGAAVSTLLGVGAELAAPDTRSTDGEIVVATRDSVHETVNEVGQALTRRNLDIQPTLTVRPGYPLRVMINTDLIFPRPFRRRLVGSGSP